MKTLRPAAPGEGDLVPISAHAILEALEALREHHIPVYQVLKGPDGTLKASVVPIDAATAVPESERGRPSFLITRDWKLRVFEADDTFEAELEPLLEQTPEERAQAVHALRLVLADPKTKNGDANVKARAIMDTVGHVFLLNKASLKLKPQEVGVYEKAVAKDTEAIVSLAIEWAEDPNLAAALFEAFEGLSNGQTVNHVLRVFASYSGFLRFYNTQHQRRLSQSVRHVFPSVYAPLYRKLLPNLEDHLLVSDHLLQFSVFGNLDLKEYALGAFLHDLGKMGNIDYFESDAPYDPAQIQQHVFLSAGLVLMNYGNDHDGARLLAGDHHNALGHPAGYGVTRRERETGMRKPQAPVRVLANNSMDFVSGASLGWLPVEMLAVADVYDAMIDDSRAYKKAMTPAQAVVFLEETMAAQGRLDPVLVDLYVDYLRSAGVEVPGDRGFAHRLKGV